MIALPMFNIVGVPVAMLNPAPAPVPAPDLIAEKSPVCRVRLINRLTGHVHRINGAPLQMFTRDPETAIEDLLRNRNTALWDVTIDRLPSRT